MPCTHIHKQACTKVDSLLQHAFLHRFIFVSTLPCNREYTTCCTVGEFYSTNHQWTRTCTALARLTFHYWITFLKSFGFRRFQESVLLPPRQRIHDGTGRLYRTTCATNRAVIEGRLHVAKDRRCGRSPHLGHRRSATGWCEVQVAPFVIQPFPANRGLCRHLWPAQLALGAHSCARHAWQDLAPRCDAWPPHPHPGQALVRPSPRGRRSTSLLRRTYPNEWC